MQETGVELIKRDVRIRPKKILSSDEIETARARAEDSMITQSHHGLSTEEPPPLDPLKPLEYVAYEVDRRVLGLLDEAPFPAQYEIDLHGYTVDEAAHDYGTVPDYPRTSGHSHSDHTRCWKTQPRWPTPTQSICEPLVEK